MTRPLKILIRLVLLALFLAAWEAAPRAGAVNPLLLPPLTDVLAVLFGLLGRASVHEAIAVTALEVIVAFLVAVPLGAAAGIAIAELPYLGAVVKPMLFYVFSIPKSAGGAQALNLVFSPVTYLEEDEARKGILGVIQNIRQNADFLRSVDRQTIIAAVFHMLLGGITCFKHKGFQEEREWRAIYCPTLLPSALMQAETQVIQGVPQLVYKLPLDVTVDPALADLDFSRLFDRLIIGPSPYPWPIYEAFTKALADSGIPDAGERVWNSAIPIRT